MTKLGIGTAEFDRHAALETKGDPPVATAADLGEPLFTSFSPASLRVQRMRSPARSSFVSLR